MNISTLRRDLKEILYAYDVAISNGHANVSRVVDEIVGVTMSQLWTHAQGDNVFYDDLSDAEFRMLSEWTIMNQKMYADRTIEMVRDMREVFPGLSLAAAAYFVRGK